LHHKHLLNLFLAEQAGGPEKQDENEDDKAEKVFVPAGNVRDTQIFDDAQE
jgi:hypothetical protein